MKLLLSLILCTLCGACSLRKPDLPRHLRRQARAECNSCHRPEEGLQSCLDCHRKAGGKWTPGDKGRL